MIALNRVFRRICQSVRMQARSRRAKINLLALLPTMLLLAGCGTAAQPVEGSATAGSSQGNPAVKTPTLERPTVAPTRRASPPGATDRVADADVLFVRAEQNDRGSWTFTVTVRHPDLGWEDYADGWDVLTPDGAVLKPDPDSGFTRTLLHPHKNEQPFTRGQSGIQIPNGIRLVIVRAHDLVDGFGGREVTVDLDAAGGPDFEVIRGP